MSISMEVQLEIKANELKRKLEGQEAAGESYIVRGMQETRETDKIKKYRSKSGNGKTVKGKAQKGPLKWYHSVAAEDYGSSEALVVSDKDSKREWILGLGCSFHMTANKDWFESLALNS